MHLQTIIQIVSLKRLILAGYILQLKSRTETKLDRRYQRRRNRHIQERDQRKRDCEIEGFDFN